MRIVTPARVLGLALWALSAASASAQPQTSPQKPPSAPQPPLPTTPQSPAPPPDVVPTGPGTTPAPVAVPPLSQDTPAPTPTETVVKSVLDTDGCQPIAATSASAQPPANSGAVLRQVELCFPTQGNVSAIEFETYLFYVKARGSRPSQNAWVPFTAEVEQDLVEDFRRLWATNFLDDLAVEVLDTPYPNGVVGKYVRFRMEERQRVKIVEYVGSKKIESTKVDEKLREINNVIRLDSFIDPGQIRRVESVVREMLAEKGYLDAEVSHVVTPVAGGPKLVNLSFNIVDGPKVQIRDIDFVGNTAMGDGKLKRAMKENKERNFLSFLTGKGVYQQAKFEEDAENVRSLYREEGYIAARVGQPEIRTLETSQNGETRAVQLRIPVTEGRRYRVGTFAFEGNTVVKGEALQPIFKLKAGDYYSEKKVRKGLEKARELYGMGGYFEFTGFPDLKPLDLVDPANPEQFLADGAAPNGPPVVDVTMRMQEGEQYFINRITFIGNSTTRDNVIRRELNLLEGGVFNTEALKNSVRRLNQLGYFKQLEEGKEGIDVKKTEGEKNKVDVTLSLQEQNRNQLTFGAGISQFEGFFGQLAFATSNFLGRGETLSLSLAAGSRTQFYQVAFTEPYLFDRPITAGIDVSRRGIQYIGAFTQQTTGVNTVWGFPVANFTRTFMQYSFERVTISDLASAFTDESVIGRNPFLQDSLLLRCQDAPPTVENPAGGRTCLPGGARTISKFVPSFVHNTVDNPIFPNTGTRFTASMDVAGLGGNTKFLKPRIEYAQFLQHTRRTSFGFRVEGEYIRAYGDTLPLPIFERLVQGGEFSVRGFDVRSIGPRDVGTVDNPGSGVVLGGNKSLLFNAEYLISIAGPVRLVLFYDAGQVRDSRERFAFNEFKTSTGAEVRFFMPVLNVPFRLIFAANPQRDGVLNNDYTPARKFQFRFAVGSTF
ncbi:MAG: outer membrane protein assembly factor BamA [Acidobacteria bacterium]|nr:outer membrane protein assembly factor BamA [Acidobacteriota bacterium]